MGEKGLFPIFVFSTGFLIFILGGFGSFLLIVNILFLLGGGGIILDNKMRRNSVNTIQTNAKCKACF